MTTPRPSTRACQNPGMPNLPLSPAPQLPVPTEDEYRAWYANAVRESRTELGETQEQVARALGVPVSVYRSWERGRATPRGVHTLALAQHSGTRRACAHSAGSAVRGSGGTRVGFD